MNNLNDLEYVKMFSYIYRGNRTNVCEIIKYNADFNNEICGTDFDVLLNLSKVVRCLILKPRPGIKILYLMHVNEYHEDIKDYFIFKPSNVTLNEHEFKIGKFDNRISSVLSLTVTFNRMFFEELNIYTFRGILMAFLYLQY